MRKIFLAICMLLGVSCFLQADVIDRFANCDDPSYTGTLEITRVGAKQINPAQEGLNQETQIFSITGPNSIETIFVESSVIQSQVSELLKRSYYSVNLTIHPDNQLVIASIESNPRAQVTYKTSIAQPTHLFVIDVNGDQKKDIIVGGSRKNDASVVEYVYQVLINQTSDALFLGAPIKPVFDLTGPVYEIEFTTETSSLPQDWCVSMIDGKPSLTMFFKNGGLVTTFNPDGNTKLDRPFGLTKDYNRMSSKILTIDSDKFSELNHFDFVSLYNKEGEDSFFVFEDIDEEEGKRQNVSVITNFPRHLASDYQIAKIFVPSPFTGEMAIMYTEPQNIAGFLAFIRLDSFDQSQNQLNWSVVNSTDVDYNPRLVQQMVTEHPYVLWYIVNGTDRVVMMQGGDKKA